jgi:hypothetical protein
MISLGRDLKEEIKNFLTDGYIGEIMQKNNITPETLRKVIDEQMPLRKIKNISTKLIKAEDVDGEARDIYIDRIKREFIGPGSIYFFAQMILVMRL